MGSLMGRTPRPAPPPARPVTAVTKTPDIEMDDTELTSEQLKKKKSGKKGLKIQLQDTATQKGSTGTGVPIPTGAQYGQYK